MKLPRYVISKSRLLEAIPLIGNSAANSIGPIILLPQSVYNDLKTQNPNPYHGALLVHEEVHRKRQKEMGYIKFGLKYLFNARFRFNEELIAVKKSMKYLKGKKLPFSFDGKAKLESKYIYLWPISKMLDGKKLKKIWDEQ